MRYVARIEDLRNAYKSCVLKPLTVSNFASRWVSLITALNSVLLYT
jgi:hypothetical protein